MSFRLFGLTGGLASGKSTVASRFRSRGVPVIDADELAREVVAPGSEGLAEIVLAFGPEVISVDGSLDRARLADLVFADEAKRRALGRIVHPRIADLSAKRAEELRLSGVRLACYEAALLVENGLADAFRPLVVVAAPRDVQIALAMKRDTASREQVEARLAAQLPLGPKIAVADFVIHNDGSREHLDDQADRVISQIEEAAAGKT